MHIGIDLGTNSSRIARTTWQGAAALVPDFQDSTRWVTPSLVFVDSDGALVGQGVHDLLEDQPAAPVFRDLSAAWEHDQPLGQDGAGRAWSAAAITALLLKKLKRDLEVQSTEPIEGVAIAVAVAASETARRTVLAAARMAGWHQAKLVEQPTAIAAHYGLLGDEAAKTVMVLDTGAGAFRASVLRWEFGQLRLLAEFIEPLAASRELDQALIRQIAEQFVRQHQFDPRTDPVSRIVLQRRTEALKAKWLSRPFGTERATFFLGGHVTEFSWLDSDFRAWIEPWLQSATAAAERALNAAGLAWPQLDHLLMSGELSAVPLIEQAFANRLPRAHEQLRSHQPSLAVACGAALWSKMQSTLPQSGQSQSNAASKPRASGTLGFHTLNPGTGELTVDPVIAADTPLPGSGQRLFRVNRPDQTRLMLELMLVPKGDSAAVSIGHFPVPLSQPISNPEITVLVDWYDADTITVTARSPNSPKEFVWTCSPANLDRNDETMTLLMQRTPLRD